MCKLFIENDFTHVRSSYFLIHLVVAIMLLKQFCKCVTCIDITLMHKVFVTIIIIIIIRRVYPEFKVINF